MMEVPTKPFKPMKNKAVSRLEMSIGSHAEILVSDAMEGESVIGILDSFNIGGDVRYLPFVVIEDEENRRILVPWDKVVYIKVFPPNERLKP